MTRSTSESGAARRTFKSSSSGSWPIMPVDFLVYPTVQVVPPTRDELAAAKYECLTFPTNTVIAAQAGLPALTIPVGFTEDGLPVGMELLGSPFSEASYAAVRTRMGEVHVVPQGSGSVADPLNLPDRRPTARR